MTSLSKARLVTIAELAEWLRVTKRAAYRLARERFHVEIGGRLLVPAPVIDRYIETHTKEPTIAPRAFSPLSWHGIACSPTWRWSAWSRCRATASAIGSKRAETLDVDGVVAMMASDRGAGWSSRA